MKKLLAAFLCCIMVISLSSCGYSEAKQNEIISMFDSFDKSQNCVILTEKLLVVRDTQYNLSEIQYNDKRCNIVLLEEDGFYAYTFDREELSVEFLFTYYESFESVLLGTETVPSNVINGFFADNCFWFRMNDPKTDEFNQIYYAWNVDTHQITIVDTDDLPQDFEYAKDNNRSKEYSFSYNSKVWNRSIDVTDNNTKITKTIDKSVLNTFEEGQKISRMRHMKLFDVAHVFERDGDVYFASFFEVGPLGDPCYYYVVKWNFETEECDFYTSFYFEEFQDHIYDMYIF